jgi:hypothetical protein
MLFSFRIGLILSDELELMAYLLSMNSMQEEAVVLFSFSEKLRRTSQISVPPIWKDDYENMYLTIKENLKTNKFENNYWSEYAGYDLDRNGIGDIPYRPVKLFSYIVHNTPETIILLRSMFVDIINFSEKVSPVFTPDNLIDANPLMHRIYD